MTAMILAALAYKDTKTLRVENKKLIPFGAWMCILACLFYDPANPVWIAQYLGEIPYPFSYIINVGLNILLVFAVFLAIRVSGFRGMFGGADIKMITLTAIAYPAIVVVITALIGYYIVVGSLILFKKKEERILAQPYFSFFTVAYLIVQFAILYIIK